MTDSVAGPVKAGRRRPDKRERLIAAAIGLLHRHGVERTTLADIDAQHRSPKARLKALVRELGAQTETVSQHGCPLGSLCSELDKRPDREPFPLAELMRLLIDWAQVQIKALGRRDSHELALDLLAAYEGSALLATTFGDPTLLAKAARRLDRWIESL